MAYIALELVPNGDLFELVKQTGPISESLAKHVARQILRAVFKLNQKGFANRDLKLENLLIDAHFNIKLVDFGFACPVQGDLESEDGTSERFLGTGCYMAPELNHRIPYSVQGVDIFAIGVILFTLVAGKKPFVRAMTSDDLYETTINDRAELFWRDHETGKPKGFFSDEFKELVTSMIACQPHQRPCLAEVVGSSWLQGTDFDNAIETSAVEVEL